MPRGEFGLDVIALVGSLRFTSPFARGVMHTVRYDQAEKEKRGLRGLLKESNDFLAFLKGIQKR